MMGPDSRETTKARRAYGRMPLIVLTAENTDKLPTLSADDQAAAFSAWTTMHDELAHLSTSGENRLRPGFGRYVQFDRPQAVVDAVAKVVETARAHYR